MVIPKDVEKQPKRILDDFSALFQEGRQFTDRELREAFAQIAEDRAFSLRDYYTKSRFNPAGKKQVAPKSATQRKYIRQSRIATSFLASAWPEQVKPIWRLQWPFKR